MIRLFPLFILLLTGGSSAHAQTPGVNTTQHLFVVSGVIVNNDSTRKIEHFIDMLGGNSGYPLKPYYVDSYSRLSQTLHQHPDALAWTCGAPFVEDQYKDQQQLIAVPLFRQAPLYKSLIVTQKNNPATSILDFRKQIFVYSDPRSNSGYVAPAWLLRQHGLNIDDFFRLKLHAGTHERSLDALYKGLANVGAIDEYIWINYSRTKPEITQKLHVIEEIGPFPFTPIVAGKKVPQSTIYRLQDTLTTLSGEELESLKKDFGLDGFVTRDAGFYKPIKDMMKDLGIQLNE